MNDAILNGNVGAVKQMLEADPSLVLRTEAAEQPIHWAAANNRAEIVELFLHFGANANCLDEDGKTPLHRAAEAQAPDAVNVLIRHGAAINEWDNLGHTPLTQ